VCVGRRRITAGLTAKIKLDDGRLSVATLVP
jgi:hypothetical protein